MAEPYHIMSKLRIDELSIEEIRDAVDFARHRGWEATDTGGIDVDGLRRLALYHIAEMIVDDWTSPYYGALPYLQAMRSLPSIDSSYGADTGDTIVAYFLANAATWRGAKARTIKAELRRRLAG